MKLRKILEAFTINKKKLASGKYEVVKGGTGRSSDEDSYDEDDDDEDSLGLDTLNAEKLKMYHNLKTGRKTWVKSYTDLEDKYGSSQFNKLDFTEQDERGFVEYVAFSLMRYLKKYAPQIKIPNHIRLAYEDDPNSNAPSFQVATSSFKNLKQAREGIKNDVYRNLVIDIYLFMILIGHADLHRGNVIVKSKDEYYIIDPELTLQDYDRALELGRDQMEFTTEPYFKYNSSYKKIADQYAKVMKINVKEEFGPIIDKCIDVAVKAMLKEGLNIEELQEEKDHLKYLKGKILYNIEKNKKYIQTHFRKYYDVEN